MYAKQGGGPMLRRRMLLLDTINSDEKYLKHWWSGEDELENGILKDRMGTGFDWLIQGNPVHENGMLIFKNVNTYAVLSGKETEDWDLGHHFKIMLDIDVMKGNFPYWSAFLDMGSVTNASKNIGFIATDVGMAINWKLKGNSSNPGLHNNPNYPDNMKFDPLKWNTVNGYISLVDKRNGYDKCVVKVNDQTYEYPVDVPKTEYKNMNNTSQSYLGRGVLNSYGTYLRLRDIKIYVYD